MHRDHLNQKPATQWTEVCRLAEIVPNTGVCALVGDQQVALFHVFDYRQQESRVLAINNVDPHAQAAVLSRGLIGSLGQRIVVASPMYKQHFDLHTGECLEAPQHSVATYPVRVSDGHVWVAV